jgi:putative membrane protein
MNGMGRVAFNVHNLFTRWQWGPFPLMMLAVLVAVELWYMQGVWALAARGRHWPVFRTVSFLGGLLAMDIAVQSPVATFTGSYFQAHVIQHLLLMAVAPPLLALGAPSTLLLQTSSRQIKQRWLAVLRSRPFAVISHPVSAWFLYFGIMYAFFLSPLINVAMHHMALMDALNLVFFFGGTLYWWPMVGIDPIVHWKMSYGVRMLNILLASGTEAFLGVAILASSRPEASMYSLASTRSGGGLLWMSTELVTLGAFIPIYIKWVHSEDRSAVRSDKRIADAELVPEDERPPADRPLTPWAAEWLARTGSVPQMSGKRPGLPGIPNGPNS